MTVLIAFCCIQMLYKRKNQMKTKMLKYQRTHSSVPYNLAHLFFLLWKKM